MFPWLDIYIGRVLQGKHINYRRGVCMLTSNHASLRKWALLCVKVYNFTFFETINTGIGQSIKIANKGMPFFRMQSLCLCLYVFWHVVMILRQMSCFNQRQKSLKRPCWTSPPIQIRFYTAGIYCIQLKEMRYNVANGIFLHSTIYLLLITFALIFCKTCPWGEHVIRINSRIF